MTYSPAPTSGAGLLLAKGADMLQRMNSFSGVGNQIKDITEAETLKTGVYSAEVYLADATPVTLPESPRHEAILEIKNVTAGDITVARNGKNIEGSSVDLTVGTLASVTLHYHRDTGWWIV